MGLAQCGKPGGIREIRQNADHPPRGHAGGRWHPEFDADHRPNGKAYPDPPIHPVRAGRVLRVRVDRGVRRRVGQQMDVSLPLGARCRPDRSAGRIARMRAAKGQRRRADAFAGRYARGWWIGSGSSAPTRPPRRRSRQVFRKCSDCSTRISRRALICSAARPAFGDFGLWGQFYELWTDPTAAG